MSVEKQENLFLKCIQKKITKIFINEDIITMYQMRLEKVLTLTGKGAVIRSLDLEDGVSGRGLWEVS